MTYLSKLFPEKHLSSIGVLLLLLVLLIVGAVPGYLSGKWQWQEPLPITNLKELKEIRNQGLNLPGWQTVDQVEQPIGEHKWSLQLLKQEGTKNQALLLLLPQNGPKDQPEIEWTDISGWGKARWGKWDIAQSRPAQLTIAGKNGKTQVEATFYRVSTNQETLAVLQWYASPNAGYATPFRWFLADQVAQLHKHRAPWVAVSILIPMEPLGQVETTWPLAQSIGEIVQARLMAGPLKISS
ncbi:cyanoexosortase B system-associated protein [Nostoc sp. TCL26-01]|uniref:cyanoexosortase B system-associated protein n=1 Tax=Nostoc sp. TCL26-01 TaxID=2576904 RepID=UPI0015B998CD|nr:cyanoexosortase B system-associated protein [Nostoc sp. TCL26-01]QLE55159.1 cyanoexosortase B system-associated protein [Nostoc sp. TCL26-01]